MPPIPTHEARALIMQARAAGIGTNELARVLGINGSTVGHWLSGTRDIPPAFAAVLRAILEFRSRSNGRPTAGTGTD